MFELSYFASKEVQNSVQPTYVDKQEKELQSLIAVSGPYFALNNLKVSPKGFLTADFQVELKNHNEVPSISLSEAGRHLAILGSLALANSNPCKEKHYYLATDAVFERVHALPVISNTFKGSVKTYSINKKRGEVIGQVLSENGELLYNAEVSYAIIHERVFERLYKNKRVVTNNYFPGNPYTHPTRFYTERINKKECRALIAMVKKNDCVGHFANFPAFPVARIGGAMINLSGIQNNLIRGKTNNFCVRKIVLHAKALIFAGNKVEILTHFNKDNREKGTLIESVAYADNNHAPSVEASCWFY